MLIVVCGLPATGKTTLSRLLASDLGAVHLRIDTIEQAIVRSGTAEHPLGAVGYTVAHALAADHLRQRLTVVAECVNPLVVTRDGWLGLAADIGVPFAEVELVCSDRAEHAELNVHRCADGRYDTCADTHTPTSMEPMTTRMPHPRRAENISG